MIFERKMGSPFGEWKRSSKKLAIFFVPCRRMSTGIVGWSPSKEGRSKLSSTLFIFKIFKKKSRQGSKKK